MSTEPVMASSTSEKSKFDKYKGSYCGAIGCRNKSKTKPFFLMPVKDEARCLQWIQNSRRDDLIGLTFAQVAKKHIRFCSDHFESDQFNVPAERKRLVWNAVPTLFDYPNLPAQVTLNEIGGLKPEDDKHTRFKKLRIARDCTSAADLVTGNINDNLRQMLREKIEINTALKSVGDCPASKNTIKTTKDHTCATDSVAGTINDSLRQMLRDKIGISSALKSAEDCPATQNTIEMAKDIKQEFPSPGSETETENVGHSYNSSNQSEHPYPTSTGSVGVGSPTWRNLMDNAAEDTDRVLNVHLPLIDTTMCKLVTEYLYLYDTFQRLKELSRINTDLLYLCSNVGGATGVKVKQEVDKVQELVQTLTNGREVYKIKMDNVKQEVDMGDPYMMTSCRDRQQNRAKGDSHERRETKVEANTSTSMKNAAHNDSDDSLDLGLEVVFQQKDTASASSENVEVGKKTVAINTLDISHFPEPVTNNIITSVSVSTAPVEWFDKTLKDRQEMEQYLNSPDCQDPFSRPFCKFCNNLFYSIKILRNHLLNHLQNKSYVCTFCHQEFKLMHDYRKHLSSHRTSDKKESYKCQECGVEFSHKYILNQHKKFTHSFVAKSEMGSLKFKSKRLLSKHLKLHREWAKKGPRKCEVCGEDLSVKDDLSVHVKCRIGDDFV